MSERPTLSAERRRPRDGAPSLVNPSLLSALKVHDGVDANARGPDLRSPPQCPMEDVAQCSTWHCGGGTGWASSPPSRTVPLKHFAFSRLRRTEPRKCGQAVESVVDNHTVVIRIHPPVRDSLFEHMCAQLCLERATTVRRCPQSEPTGAEPTSRPMSQR